jgi:hypothetical protein
MEIKGLLIFVGPNKRCMTSWDIESVLTNIMGLSVLKNGTKGASTSWR